MCISYKKTSQVAFKYNDGKVKHKVEEQQYHDGKLSKHKRELSPYQYDKLNFCKNEDIIR